MCSAAAVVSFLLLGLAAGLSAPDASVEDPVPAGAEDSDLEAAAAALAGLLAAGADADFSQGPPQAQAQGAMRQRRRRADPQFATAPGGGATGGGPGGPGGPGSPDWIMGLGVLSNMQQFFDNLRNNLESLETLSKDERESLLRQPTVVQAEHERAYRPRATAAYLHALRNHRPSHKIRNFVSEPQPASLRGSNHYDPNLLWAGLGRRR